MRRLFLFCFLAGTLIGCDLGNLISTTRGTVVLEDFGSCAGITVRVTSDGTEKTFVSGSGGQLIIPFFGDSKEMQFAVDGYEPVVRDLTDARGVVELGQLKFDIETVPVEGSIRMADGADPSATAFSLGGDIVTSDGEINYQCGDGDVADDDFSFGGQISEAADGSGLAREFEATDVQIRPDGRYTVRVPRRSRDVSVRAERTGYTRESRNISREEIEAATEDAPLSVDEIVLFPLTGFINIVGGPFQNDQTVTLQISGFNGVSQMALGEVTGATCDVGPWLQYDAETAYSVSDGDGEKTVCARLRNELNQQVTDLQRTFLLDTEAPGSISAAFAGGSAISQRFAPVELFATDTGSGLDDILLATTQSGLANATPVPFELSKIWDVGSSDGPKELWVQFSDRAGNLSDPLRAATVLDTIAPQPGSTTTMLINGGAAGTNNPILQLTLDVDGATQMRFSASTNFAGVMWQPFEPAAVFQTNGIDGTKQVYAQFRDAAGQVLNDNDSIQLDQTPPSLTDFDILGSGNVSDTTLSLQISADDGLNPVFVEIDDDLGFNNPVAFQYGGGVAVTSYTLPTPTSGIHLVHARYCDIGGNCAGPFSDSVILDLDGPTNPFVEIEQGAFANDTQLDLSLSASGADEMAIREDSGPFTNFDYVAYKPTDQFAVSAGDGPKTIWVMFRDFAGHVTGPVSDTVQLDQTDPVPGAPAILIEGGAASTPNRVVNVDLAVSGATQLRLSESQTFAGAIWNDVTDQVNFPLSSAEGDKTLYVQYRDDADNRTAVFDASIFLDLTPPSNGAFSIADAAVTSPTLTLKLNATDSGNVTAEVGESLGTTSPTLFLVAGSTQVNYTLTDQSEGFHVVYVRYCDTAGNCTDWFSDSVVLDDTDPASPFVAVRGGAYSNSANITLDLFASGADQVGIRQGDANFQESDFSGYAPEKAFTLTGGDGPKTVWVLYRDLAGNITGPVSDVVRLDTTAPVAGTTPILIQGGVPSISDRVVFVDLDVTGATEMRLSESASLAGAPWVQYDTPAFFTLSGDEGNKVLYAQFRDPAGNVIGPFNDDVVLDSGPPTGISFSIDGPSTVSSPTVTVSILANDTGTVFGRLSESSSFNNPVSFSFNLGNYVTQYTFNDTDDGLHSLYAELCDAADNCSGTLVDFVILDQTAPSGTISINAAGPTIVDSTVTLNLSAGDAGSGVDRVRLAETLADLTTANTVLFEATKIWNFTGGDGEKRIFAQFLDKAGNASVAVSDDIILDATPPTLTSIDINGGAPVTNSIFVSVAVNQTGADELAISEDSTFGGVSWLPITSQLNFALSSNPGTKRIYLKVRDNAGNVSGPVNADIELDNIAPVIDQVRLAGGLGATSSTTIEVEIQQSGDAVEMELASESAVLVTRTAFAPTTTVTLDTVDGVRAVYVTVWDALGNKSEVAFDTILVDTTPPNVGFMQIDGGAAGANDEVGDVTLTLFSSDVGSGLDHMQITNTTGSGCDFGGALAEDFVTVKLWVLDDPGPGRESERTVCARFQDVAGNWSTPTSDDIFYDTNPPVALTNAVLIEGGAPFAFSQLVLLTINVAGATEMRFSESPSLSGAAWTPVSDSALFALREGDGEKTVWAEFRDAGGNVAPAVNDTIILDTAAPVDASFAISGPSVVSSPTLQLILSAQDDSGSIRADIDEELGFSAPTQMFLTATTMVTDYTLEDISEGIHTIYVRYCDEAGKCVGPFSDSIELDLTPPQSTSIEIEGTGFVNHFDIDLNLFAVGAVSMAVAETSPSFGPDDYEPYKQSKIFDVSAGDGLKTIWASFADNAGNISVPVSATVVVDTVPPVASSPEIVLAGGAAGVANQVVTVDFNVTGANEYRIGESSGLGGATWLPLTNNVEFVLSPAEGNKTVFVDFRDFANNIVGTFNDQIELAFSGPEGASFAILEDGAVTSATVDISLGAVDAGGTIIAEIDETVAFDAPKLVTFPSGSTLSTYTLKNASDGQHTVFVRFCDTGGRCSVTLSDDVVIDTQLPTGTISINGGAAATADRDVSLSIFAYDGQSGVDGVKLANSNGSLATTDIVPWQPNTNWKLTAGDGSKTVWLQVIDGAGNPSIAESAQIDLDTSAPTAITVEINSGDDLTLSRTVNVAVQAPDAADMQLSEDPGFAGAAWVEYASLALWNLTDGNGLKTLYVRVRDAAGNPSLAVTDTITLNETAPGTGPIIDTFIVNGGAVYSSSLTVNINLNILNAPTRVRLRDGSGAVLYDGAPVSNTAVTLTPGQGLRTIDVTAWNAGGTPSGEVTRFFTVDTIAPATAIQLVGSNHIADPDITLQLSAIDAGGIDTANVSEVYAAAASNYEIALVPSLDWTLTRGDGLYTFWLTVTDLAGNTSTPVSAVVTLDRSAPLGLTVAINGGATATTQLSVNLAVAATGASDMQVSNDPAMAGVPWVDYAANSLWTLTSGNGLKAVYVRVRDAAGNIAGPVSDTILLNESFPGLDPGPSIDTFTVENGDTLVNTTNLLVDLAISDSPTLLEISDDLGFVLYSGAPLGQTTVSITPGDGFRALSARAWNATMEMSNIETRYFVLDTTKPKVSFTIDNDALVAVTNDVSLQISANDSGSGVTAVRVANSEMGLNGAVWQALETPLPWTLPGGTGTAMVWLQVLDGAGNTSNPASDSITYDNVPPTTIFLDVPEHNSTEFAVLFDFTCNESRPELCSFVCAFDGWPSLSDACEPPVAYAPGTTGIHTFRVRSIDGRGNVEVTAAAYSWNATPQPDSVSPTVTLTKTPGTYQFITTATFLAETNEPVTSVSCRLDGELPVDCTDGPLTAAWHVFDLTSATHSVELTAWDFAGNFGVTSYSWTVSTPPLVSFTMLGKANADNSFVQTNYTRGLVFDLAQSSQLTGIWHYFGEKITVWGPDQSVIVSVDTSGVTDGTWNYVPLPAPVGLTAASGYRIGAYNSSGSIYRLDPYFMPKSFSWGTIQASAWTIGDTYPGSSFTFWAVLVDFNLVPDSDLDNLSDYSEVITHFTDIYNPDSDDDLINDQLEVEQFGTDPTDPNDPDPTDSDGDGLSDFIETNIYGSSTQSTDSDSDTLTDYAESITYGTDPNNADTDSDLAFDDLELLVYFTDPLSNDTDQDGVLDGDEILTYGSDPTNPETDGDTVPDGMEVAAGSDPALAVSVPDPFPEFEPNNNVSGCQPLPSVLTTLEVYGDGDGTYDYYCFDVLETGTLAFDIDAGELGSFLNPRIYLYTDTGSYIAYNDNGIDPDSGYSSDSFFNYSFSSTGTYVMRIGECCPSAPDNSNEWYYFEIEWPDADGDGISDQGEAQYGSDPTNADTDGDFINDYLEIVELNSSVTDPNDPPTTDSDGDGLSDYVELNVFGSSTQSTDSDGDGLSDFAEAATYNSDPTTSDTDGDTLSDASEVLVHFTDPTTSDTDNDILSDADELFVYSTDPNVRDMDGDLAPDGYEVASGSDPEDFFDIPNPWPDIEDNQPSTACEPIPSYLARVEIFGTGDGTFDHYCIDVRETGTFRFDIDAQELGAGFNPTLRLSNLDESSIFTASTNDIDPDSGYGSDPFISYTLAATDTYVIKVGRCCLAPLVDSPAVFYTLEIEFPDDDGDGLANQGETDYGSDPTDPDSDGDLINDYLELVEFGTDMTDANDPPFVDSDGDGISDFAEVNVYGSSTQSTDTDGDGLGDYAEAVTYGTNPALADSDADALTDYVELLTYMTNPLTSDTDADLLDDYAELLTYGTDPLTRDTDTDQFDDGYELFVGTGTNDRSDYPANPLVELEPNNWPSHCQLVPSYLPSVYITGEVNGSLDAYCFYIFQPGEVVEFDVDADELGSPLDSYLTLYDADGNDIDSSDDDPDQESGFYNLDSHISHSFSSAGFYIVEVGECCVNTGFTGAWYEFEIRFADDEGDGLSNQGEVQYGTDPTAADSDGDFVVDFDEVVLLGTDATDPTDPPFTDNDSDGLNDYLELNIYGSSTQSTDSDGDLLPDYDEVVTHGSSPASTDTDADALSDYSEVVTYPTDPADWDSDDDLLSDGDEILVYGTDPTAADSDGDKVNDGDEIADGFDPLDPNHFPPYVNELEPNDSPATCQFIPDNISSFTVTNGTGNNTFDYFCINIPAGAGVVEFDIDAEEFGSPLDSYMQLFDETGAVELIDSDDDPDQETGFWGYDSHFNWTFATPGTYVIQVGEYCCPDLIPSGEWYWLQIRFQDSDDDGLADYLENSYGSATNVTDSDGDGLLDGAEVHEYRTNPTTSDTDGDLISDSEEINNLGTDPNDGADPPFGPDITAPTFLPGSSWPADGELIGFDDAYGNGNQLNPAVFAFDDPIFDEDAVTVAVWFAGASLTEGADYTVDRTQSEQVRVYVTNLPFPHNQTGDTLRFELTNVRDLQNNIGNDVTVEIVYDDQFPQLNSQDWGMSSSWRAIYLANETITSAAPMPVSFVHTLSGVPVTGEPDTALSNGSGYLSVSTTNDLYYWVPRDLLADGEDYTVSATQFTDLAGNGAIGDVVLNFTVCCDFNDTPTTDAILAIQFADRPTGATSFNIALSGVTNNAFIAPHDLDGRPDDLRIVLDFSIETAYADARLWREGAFDAEVTGNFSSTNQSNDTVSFSFADDDGSFNWSAGEFYRLSLRAFDNATSTNTWIELAFPIQTTSSDITAPAITARGGERSAANGVDPRIRPGEPLLFAFSEQVDPRALVSPNLEIVSALGARYTVDVERDDFSKRLQARAVNAQGLPLLLPVGDYDFEFVEIPDISMTANTASGSFAFEVSVADAQGPNVLFSSPNSGATNVDTNARIEVTLDDAVSRASLRSTGTTFGRGLAVLERWGNGVIPLKGIGHVDSSDLAAPNVVRLGRTDGSWRGQMTYEIHLLDGIHDIDGDAIASGPRMITYTVAATDAADVAPYIDWREIAASILPEGLVTFGGDPLHNSLDVDFGFRDRSSGDSWWIELSNTQTGQLNRGPLTSMSFSESLTETDFDALIQPGTENDVILALTDSTGNTVTALTRTYVFDTALTTTAAPVTADGPNGAGTYVLSGSIADTVEAAELAHISVLIFVTDESATPPMLVDIPYVSQAQVTRNGDGTVDYSHTMAADQALPPLTPPFAYRAGAILTPTRGISSSGYLSELITIGTVPFSP